jgi:hypothetical protein
MSVSASISIDSFSLGSPVCISYALIIDSFTLSNNAFALSISALSPIAIVDGLCINICASGDINITSPAIAIILADEAAIASIFTVTLPDFAEYSLSILYI